MIKIFKILGIMLIVPLLCITLTGCKATAPELEITSPADGETLNTSPVTVEGKVSSLETTVTINGEEALVRLKMEPYGLHKEYAAFFEDVELSQGKNTITVVATLNGQEESQTITVTYTPTG